MEQTTFIQVTTPEVIKFNLNNLRNLVFEVTDACNLQCKYCGYSELYEGYDEREDTYLTFRRAKILIDHLAEIWRANKSEKILQPITVGFYGGEPLMNMTFIQEVVAYMESLTDIGKAVAHNMTTNAMLLDRYMDYLAEKKITLLISLDGDEQGQSYRIDKAGNNSFSRVIRNVRLLRDKHPDYFNKHVNFNTVLHNRNDVEGVFSFINKEFQKTPRIAALNDAGIRPEKREEFYRTYKNPHQSFEAASDCKKLTEEMFLDARR